MSSVGCFLFQQAEKKKKCSHFPSDELATSQQLPSYNGGLSLASFLLSRLLTPPGRSEYKFSATYPASTFCVLRDVVLGPCSQHLAEDRDRGGTRHSREDPPARRSYTEGVPRAFQKAPLKEGLNKLFGLKTGFHPSCNER